MSVKQILGQKPVWSSTNFKPKHLSLPDDTTHALHRYKQEYGFRNISAALDHILRKVLLDNVIDSNGEITNGSITLKPHQPLTAQKND
jgi:ATP-dependent Lon protease